MHKGVHSNVLQQASLSWQITHLTGVELPWHYVYFYYLSLKSPALDDVDCIHPVILRRARDPPCRCGWCSKGGTAHEPTYPVHFDGAGSAGNRLGRLLGGGRRMGAAPPDASCRR